MTQDQQQQALILKGVEKFALLTLPIPTPGERDVLIQVSAVGYAARICISSTGYQTTRGIRAASQFRCPSGRRFLGMNSAEGWRRQDRRCIGARLEDLVA